MHFCKDLLWCSNCTQGCGWCAESCRQLWGKPQTALAIPGTLDLGNIRVYLITHLCSFAGIQNLTHNLGINRLQTKTLKDRKSIFRCSHCPQGCGGCAESCQQLWGKPANSFGTPCRHLRAVQTSARTENRKQLLLRIAIPGSLEGKPFAKSCAAQPWPRLAAAAGRAMQRQLAIFAELRSILSFRFSVAVESIFSAQFSGHVCNSPLLAHIFSAVGLSQIWAKGTSPTHSLCKAMFTQLTPAPFIPDNTFVSKGWLAIAKLKPL